MKKKVAVALVVVVVAWTGSSLLMRDAKPAASGRAWPMDLGTIDAVPNRHPPTRANDAAREFDRLAEGNDIDAIRALLLSGTTLVWESDIRRGVHAPMPDVRAALRVSKALTTDRWDDLHAQWQLAKALWSRPELISNVAALTITRNVVGAAQSQDSPAPRWFEELRTYPFRRSMLAAMQADTWAATAMMRDYAERGEGGNFLQRAEDFALAPYYHLSRADYLTTQRNTAIALANGEPYAMSLAWWNEPAQLLTPNIALVWERVGKLEADVKRVTP